jgi:hypothetical protein
MSATPLLSAIVITRDTYEAVRTTVRHLRAQSLHDRMEVVLIAPSRATLQADDEELGAFHSVRIVEMGEAVRSEAAGYAAGIRHAAAPVVVFTEDHCFPATGWAEALVRAHEGPWAAVGPVVANANGDGVVSWADFLLGYGPWLDPTPAGPVEYLPGHNSSYKREVLLAYEPDLEAWLDAESNLHWDLRARGHGLYLEPAARTFHFNYSRVSAWLPATFFSSRTFAGRRARPWGIGRRLVYALGSPLIPAIRLRRCVRDFRRSRRRPSVVRILPAITLSLTVSAMGEAMGYLFGPGDAPVRVSEYEFHRTRHVTSADRAAMAQARFAE